jgi:hypothetical protein
MMSAGEFCPGNPKQNSDPENKVNEKEKEG